MLIGVLDGTEVRYESREASTGQSEDELVELLVREVGEAREARPDAAAVGLGIPATIDQASGVAVSAVNLSLTEVPIRDVVSERVGLPVFLDNDGNVAGTAQKLFTHRHTIRYRLERVRELSGLDVGSTDGREKLSLGLKAMRVLGVAAPAGRVSEARGAGSRVAGRKTRD